MNLNVLFLYICCQLFEIGAFQSSINMSNACYKDSTGKLYLAVRYLENEFTPSNYFQMEISMNYYNLTNNEHKWSEAARISLGMGKDEHYFSSYRFNYLKLVERVTHEMSSIYGKLNIFVDFVPFKEEAFGRTFVLKFLKRKNDFQKTSTAVAITLQLYGFLNFIEANLSFYKNTWMGWIYECPKEQQNLTESLLTMFFYARFMIEDVLTGEILSAVYYISNERMRLEPQYSSMKLVNVRMNEFRNQNQFIEDHRHYSSTNEIIIVEELDKSHLNECIIKQISFEDVSEKF
ncbi:hypothetical protein RF11_14628 [Thelohanellus kitauei]|uniref:Uncharacterized protein n=1 Tax=Thelohanellus kitauei TaxID=669202 RepID=A0A0C2JWE2_THEKT|nr:hypothetical protein RF11_14628 [Thelohanellus kitauei]